MTNAIIKNRSYYVLTILGILLFCICIIMLINGPLKRYDPDKPTIELYLFRLKNFSILVFLFALIQTGLSTVLCKQRFKVINFFNFFLKFALLGVLVFLLFEFVI